MAHSTATPLGKGTYGSVVRIDNRAVKSFDCTVPEGRIVDIHKPLLQEYAALRYLANTGCQYVVRPTDVNISRNQLSMEVYDMNLRNWRIRNLGLAGYHQQARTILHDILCGLVELHDRGLVHADFKPSNILISLNPLRAVLGDVGFVSIAKYTKVDRTGPLYRDPTPVRDSAHDMFSLGMIMFELVTGHHLTKLGSHDDYQNIAQTYVKDPEYLDVINNLFQADYTQRYSARELLLRIFAEDYPRWQVPDIIATVVPKPEVRQQFKEKNRQFGIPRERLGYYSLLAVNNDPDQREMAAMLYLLSVMFICDPACPDPLNPIRPRRFTNTEAIRYGNCSNEELCQIVIKLIDSPTVLQTIMSCATRNSRSPPSSTASSSSSLTNTNTTTEDW